MTSSASSLLALLVITAAFVVAVPANTRVEPMETKCQLSDPSEQPVALFDFEAYQRLFKKHYATHLEALKHQVYFVASVMKVYIAGLAYRFRLQSHYLAVNHMSDQGPHELELMENKVMAGRSTMTDKSSLNEEDLHVDPARVPSGPEEEVLEIVEEANLEGLLPEEELRQKFMNTETGNGNVKLRPLPINMLIKSEGSAAVGSARVQGTGCDSRAGSDLSTKQGSVEENSRSESLFQKVLKVISPFPLEDSNEETDFWDPSSYFTAKPNEKESVGPVVEMFTDLRQTGCLSEPRDQGKCGSCYAFAGIALAEFLYCNATGQLLEFSEQYMVDCGNGMVARMEGCQGGVPENIPQFIHKYGLELRAHYPYVAQQGECPYNLRKEPKRAGAIRMPLERFGTVSIDDWPLVLKMTPIHVSIATPPDFAQYGGGVIETCGDVINHGMLVVGHGRQEGQEFWLLRNSHGTGWGERGYFKLAKSAPARCIDLQAGFVSGVATDVSNYNVEPIINPLNDWTLLRRLQSLRAEQMDGK